MNNKKEMYFNGIPASELILSPGNWTIQYENKEKPELIFKLLYVLKKETPLKDLNLDDSSIIRVRQERG